MRSVSSLAGRRIPPSTLFDGPLPRTKDLLFSESLLAVGKAKTIMFKIDLCRIECDICVACIGKRDTIHQVCMPQSWRYYRIHHQINAVHHIISFQSPNTAHPTCVGTKILETMKCNRSEDIIREILDLSLNLQLF